MSETEFGPNVHLGVALVQRDAVLVLLNGQPLGQPEVGGPIEGLVAELFLKRQIKHCVKIWAIAPG